MCVKSVALERQKVSPTFSCQIVIHPSHLLLQVRQKQMLRIIICKYTFPRACFQIITPIFNAAVDVAEPSR